MLFWKWGGGQKWISMADSDNSGTLKILKFIFSWWQMNARTIMPSARRPCPLPTKLNWLYFIEVFIQYGDMDEVILRHRHFYNAAMIFFNVVSELKRDVSGRCYSGLSGRITSCDRVVVTFPSRTAGQTNRHSLMRGRPSHHLQGRRYESCI